MRWSRGLCAVVACAGLLAPLSASAQPAPVLRDAPAAAESAAPSDVNQAPAAGDLGTNLAPSPCPGGTCKPQPTAANDAPFKLWVSAGWSNALGTGRCSGRRLEGAEQALRMASMLQRLSSGSGMAVAAAGALGDHPLLTYAARHDPQRLAALLARQGYVAIAVGVSDLSGPLARDPALARALAERGIQVVASNLICDHQPWCESWQTAEDPPLIVQRAGQRMAFSAVLPDDISGRVEPAGGHRFKVLPAAQTLAEQTRAARTAHVDWVVASIDHGPDATASVSLADFVAKLPEQGRPDILLSPSAGDHVLFLRPLNVRPALVGTRSGTLTSVHVTRLPDSDDADVLARRLPLHDVAPDVAAALQELAAGYCSAQGVPLPGGHLDAPLGAQQLVELAADTARQLARADLALVDPRVFEPEFSDPAGTQLQLGEAARTVELDAPLVTASVTLDWIGELNKRRSGVRPLVLIGAATDGSQQIIGGRDAVPGALYRIVTTTVIARSGRLPDGAAFEPLEGPNATLRGALLAPLDANDARDPRNRLRDPLQDTQWILRLDNLLQGNLTAVRRRSTYPDPSLQVDDSREVVLHLLLNMDADSPKFLFENLGQIQFDRNFATHTTAQDLVFVQSTYTYRGLWDRSLLYPHPFVEGYLETEFARDQSPYFHLLLRPEAGFRSLWSSVLSLKVSAGLQYEVFAPGTKVYPGVGAEIVLKPWTVKVSGGTLNLEGNLIYFWSAPGIQDQQTLRGQLIAGWQVVGPLQLTLSALGFARKDRNMPLGRSITVQTGIRILYLDRLVSE